MVLSMDERYDVAVTPRSPLVKVVLDVVNHIRICMAWELFSEHSGL